MVHLVGALTVHCRRPGGGGVGPLLPSLTVGAANTASAASVHWLLCHNVGILYLATLLGAATAWPPPQVVNNQYAWMYPGVLLGVVFAGMLVGWLFSAWASIYGTGAWGTHYILGPSK